MPIPDPNKPEQHEGWCPLGENCFTCTQFAHGLYAVIERTCSIVNWALLFGARCRAGYLWRDDNHDRTPWWDRCSIDHEGEKSLRMVHDVIRLFGLIFQVLSFCLVRLYTYMRAYVRLHLYETIKYWQLPFFFSFFIYLFIFLRARQIDCADAMVTA